MCTISITRRKESPRFRGKYTSITPYLETSSLFSKQIFESEAIQVSSLPFRRLGVDS